MGDTQLNATADVAGSFVYTPVSGTKLNAGTNQQLSVAFTPTDSANFNNANANVTINVSKADPVVTWNNPADITFGTLLGDIQLNATADVAGSFVYNPAAGTQLDAGANQQLSVAFTPTDSVNFNEVLSNVSINVLSIPLNADAGGPYAIDAGANLSLNGSGSTGPGTLSFRWDFNNDGTADFTTADAISSAPWLTLANLGLGAGPHTIRLVVADNSGVSAPDTATLTISSTFVFTPPAGAQANQFTLSRTNNQIEVRDSNPPNTLLSSVPATGVQQVAVTGSANDDTLTVDYTNGDPLPAGGIAFAGAGGRNTFVIGGHDVTLDLTNQTAFRFTAVEVLNIVGAGPNTLKLTPADVLRVTDGSDTLTIVSDTDETVDLGTGWRITSTAVDTGKFVRILTSGAATLRMIGPKDWTNPLHPLDVNADRFISPLDVLITINEQNSPRFRDGQGALTSAAGVTVFPNFYFDASGDGFLSPLDTLQIINHLNDKGSTAVPEGEGERGEDGEMGSGGARLVGWVATQFRDEAENHEAGNHARRSLLATGQGRRTSWVATQPTTPDPVSAPQPPTPHLARSAPIADREELERVLDDLFAEEEFWR